MSDGAIPTWSVLARPWGDSVWSVDCDVVTGALFALFVQHAWGSDGKSSTPMSNECSAQQTELAGETCDLVGVSAGSGKPPVYSTTEGFDQTLQVLNAHSAPELQTGLFHGVGRVSPRCATLDLSMRKIRRAGKWALRNKDLKSEKRASGADGQVFAHGEAVGDKSSAGMPKTCGRP